MVKSNRSSDIPESSASFLMNKQQQCLSVRWPRPSPCRSGRRGNLHLLSASTTPHVWGPAPIEHASISALEWPTDTLSRAASSSLHWPLIIYSVQHRREDLFFLPPLSTTGSDSPAQVLGGYGHHHSEWWRQQASWQMWHSGVHLGDNCLSGHPGLRPRKAAWKAKDMVTRCRWERVKTQIPESAEAKGCTEQKEPACWSGSQLFWFSVCSNQAHGGPLGFQEDKKHSLHS